MLHQESLCAGIAEGAHLGCRLLWRPRHPARPTRRKVLLRITTPADPLHEAGDAGEIVGLGAPNEEASHRRSHQCCRLASGGGAGGVECGELLARDLRR